MGEEDKNPNPIELVPDLLEEILLRVPLNSILNYAITFPRDYAIGFGKDIVNGSYKIVRIYFEPNYYCEILDLSIGEWRKLANSPPNSVEARRKSAYVNGSIYWLEVYPKFMVLALDLHTEKFRKVPPPPSASRTDQLVNLEDRLTIATTFGDPHPRILEIWRLDAHEETWSMSYSIRLDLPFTLRMWELLFWPVTVSKRGNVFFHDNVKRLFKHYPETDRLCCVSSDICIVSSFVENLVPFGRSEFEYRFGLPELKTSRSLDDVPISRISKTVRQIKLKIPSILTATVASFIIFRYSLFRLGLDSNVTLRI